VVNGSIDIGATEAQRYLVTNNNDRGPGSLRQAILDNNAADGGIIVFDAGLAGQTITLTSGELAINHDATITGLGASQLAVSGNNASRIFDIATPSTVSIAGLTLTGGATSGVNTGAAAFTQGVVSFNDCVLTGNVSSQNGGAISASAL
jgi:predicted outer membrane repeat protein